MQEEDSYNIFEKNRCLILAVIGFLLNFIFCQYLLANTLPTDSYSFKEGLAQANITSITQDQYGFMWFGTQDGLHRFDGYEFKIYKPDPGNPNSISNNSIWALSIDRQGKLWVGTNFGLNMFDIHSEKFTVYMHDSRNPESISNNVIHSLYTDRDGNVWIGTLDGLNRFDFNRKKFIRYQQNPKFDNSINNNVVNEIFQDSEGYIWVGTNQGINQYDSEADQFVKLNHNLLQLKEMVITAIAEDSKGRIWIGTAERGIFVYDKTDKSIFHHVYLEKNENSLSENKINVIYKDNKNLLWIGTRGGGVVNYDNDVNRFKRYSSNPDSPHVLNDNVIFSFYESYKGEFWIGTLTQGLHKLNLSHLRSSLVSDKATVSNKNPQTDLRAFLIDNKGSLWTGSTQDGVQVKHINGAKQIFKHEPNNPYSLSRNQVYSILQDKAGTIWVGTEGGWLNRFNKKSATFTRYQIQTRDGSIRHERVRTLLEDSQGLFWVGVENGGLHTFDREKGEFIHYHYDPENVNSLSNNRVFKIHEDRYGIIWVATYGGGLNKFHRKSRNFTRYTYQDNSPNTISSNYILSICEDNNKNVLWLGTSGGGFDRVDLNNNSFINFNEKHGLANNTVYGILQDDNGSLWMTTNKGMSKYDPKTNKFKNYDQQDGLQSNEFNGGAYYRGSDGRFYVGGLSGYNAFYPDKITNNPHKPYVYITEFQLFNKPVEVNKSYNNRVIMTKPITDLELLTLSYKESVISFKYAALDFTQPGKNQYAYKMEGLDMDWNFVNNKRDATYTSLPPGNYRFRVKASNNDGVWNEQGASLSITITPPFWKTWWFRTVILLIVMLGLLSIHTARIRSINIRNKMLKQQVKERTSDLEEALYELVHTKDAFEESSKVATGALHNVGNLLNSVNTSIAIIQKMIYESVTKKFVKANSVLRGNIDNLEEFILNQDKGKKLMQYYLSIEKSIQEEQQELNKNVLRSIEKISAIKEAISAQQRSAQGHGFVETLPLRVLVDETIMLQSGSSNKSGIIFERRYDKVPDIRVEKAKLVQILLNLFKNARESMDEAEVERKIITIEISKDTENAYIKVSDTGLGIAPDNVNSMFTYGYTTKTSGHGFGLHSCANYMKGMGGSISVFSAGVGQGATFILQFPLKLPSLNASEKEVVEQEPYQKASGFDE